MVFGFLKKKKQKTHLELPPPPEPPSEVDVRKLGDFEPIKPAAEPEEVTEIPKPPELAETPEIVPSDKTEPIPIPAPELPAFPELPPLEPQKEETEIVETPAQPVFDRTVEKEIVRKPVGPIFVSVDEYRKIIDDSNRVKAKLSEAEEFVQRLTSLKVEEEKTFERWQTHLEEMERKLGRIDKLLARAKGG